MGTRTREHERVYQRRHGARGTPFGCAFIGPLPSRARSGPAGEDEVKALVWSVENPASETRALDVPLIREKGSR